MMTSKLSVPLCSTKGSLSVPSSFDPMNNLFPLIDSSLVHQQEHMYFSSMMNNSNGMKPPSHYAMYLNDGDHRHHQTQLIIHVSAAIPIQQF